ncbi:MAG: putative DNA-binding domain-containing protein [Dehalococcoidia bacterium]
MRLAELQRAFQSRVLHGDRAIEPVVPGTERLDTETRLGIYENAFVARLVEALADTYPALRNAVGESEFAELVRTFAKQSPPVHFSIRYFGSDLASFIATAFPGVKAKVLSDLARWEWALSEAFDAADAVALTKADLERIEPAQWAGLQFRLSPSLRRVCLRSNAVQWWRAASQQAARPTRWRSAMPVEWALWRSQLKTYFRSLPNDEAWALKAVAGGQPFASMCEGLVQFAGAVDAPTRAATLLQRWVRDEWIVGIEIPADSEVAADLTSPGQSE